MKGVGEEVERGKGSTRAYNLRAASLSATGVDRVERVVIIARYRRSRLKDCRIGFSRGKDEKRPGRKGETSRKFKPRRSGRSREFATSSLCATRQPSHFLFAVTPIALVTRRLMTDLSHVRALRMSAAFTQL